MAGNNVAVANESERWGDNEQTALGTSLHTPLANRQLSSLTAIHDGAQVVAMFSSPTGKLPHRGFVVVEHERGGECISFDGPPSLGCNLTAMASLDD